MILKISWKNIWAKPSTSFLAILLMTFGISIISLLIQVGTQLEEKFSKNITGIDMVVGAKGSPLQLILSSVFQIDSPTGNIKLAEAQQLASNPMVKKWIPLAMGDSYLQYRIVGTTPAYIKHFEATFGQGQVFQSPMDVVIGAQVAVQTGLKIGDTFASSHGLDGEGEAHGEHPFKVTGILAPSNSVLDNLVITSLESVWEVHGDHSEASSETPKEITAALIQFRSPMGLMTLPRNINANTTMQAALPAIEVNRLFELLGIGITTLQYLAWAIMFISGISVFITLYNSLKERKYELALLLSLGATRTKLFLTLLFEGLFLVGVGALLGLVVSRVGIAFISGSISSSLRMQIDNWQLLPAEITLVLAAIFLGILASAIPSIGIYKLDISKTLADD